VTAAIAGQYREARVAMDTVVSIDIPAPRSSADERQMIDRAFGWFSAVESACSRFDQASEVMRLCATVDTAVPVSSILFEAVRFAVAVAGLTNGAFDPTVGGLMEARGFNRNYRTGLPVASGLPAGPRPSYRDLEVDAVHRTVTLHRPLVLDLGAVVKGLAIDLAARELVSVRNYAIDAGGDILVRGHNRDGSPWRVGVRHPRQPATVWCVLELSDAAVCTSGDYARRGNGIEHHLVDPRTGNSPRELLSATVVAPNAMLADALSTAAFVLGREGGLRVLTEQGLEGLTLDRTMDPGMTRGFDRLVAARPA
jgi:thiamine biosynthesis lipoprotein